MTHDTEAVEIPAAETNKDGMSATDLSKPRKAKAAKAKASKKTIIKAKGKGAAKAAKVAKPAKAAKVKAAPKAKGTPGRKRSAVPTTKAQGNVPVPLFKLMVKAAKEQGIKPAAIVNLALRKYFKYED